jgi:tetratricopeptide (TPR) repeat protein
MLVCATPVAAQIPQTFRNLRHFPADISSAQLMQRMREFSLALDVRCQHCHSGGDGVSFDGVDFASDDKPQKVTARAMLRMVDELNGPVLGALPVRAEPRVTIECVTCHRGVALPRSLRTTLLEVVAKEGAAAAAQRYRALRRDTLELGRYNLGALELLEVSRTLRERGSLDAAVAILELNGEFHPDDAGIDFELGEVLRARGDRAGALERYRRALEKRPDMAPARRRISELEKPPQ